MPKTLTVKQIEALKGKSDRQEIPDALVQGLYVIVQKSGAKSWAVRYRNEGRTRKMTLGRYPGINLSEARDLAREALRLVELGIDPAISSAGEAEVRTVFITDAIAQFVERYVRPQNRPSSAKETERLLSKNVASAWANKSLREISRQDVLSLIDGIVDRGAGITANRTLAALRRFFNWCVERGMLEVSPSDKVKAPSPERSRDRVLSDGEIRLVWTASKEVGWPFGDIVRILLLTAQRRGEVANLHRSEISREQVVWKIPASRSKNGLAHDVPLSPMTLEIIIGINALNRSFLFSTEGNSGFSGFSRSKRKLDEIIKRIVAEGKVSPDVTKFEAWTLHDLRRTAATGMSRLGISLQVVEKILNHQSGSFSGVVGVYQRHSYAEEKQVALLKWSQFVETLVGE